MKIIEIKVNIPQLKSITNAIKRKMKKLSAITIKLDTYIKKEHPDIDNGKPSRG
ncbi:hypothetical protein [Bacillus paramobilis]|uniref:hypothetical protein n=1 Tax=Bacillus paramobilis TaxID=2817477 RepID=UPI003216A511